MIIIDSDNYAEHGVETLFFPGGEPHAKIPRFHERIVLWLKARTWNDVGIGACVWDALRYQHMTYADTPPPVLFMPYSPGARQDRTDGHAPLTRNIISGMFGNSSDIHVFDIHSKPLWSLWLPIVWMPSHLQIKTKPDVVGIIAPDEGAVHRAESFRDWYYPDVPLIRCEKDRDPYTGKLSGYVYDTMNLGKVAAQKGRYIVVDDICDGGGTFLLLAKAFREIAHPDAKLELFVSHGIFSKGPDLLLEQYDHITTTDSFWNWQYIKTAHRCQHMTVLPLRPIMENYFA